MIYTTGAKLYQCPSAALLIYCFAYGISAFVDEQTDGQIHRQADMNPYDPKIMRTIIGVTMMKQKRHIPYTNRSVANKMDL